MINVFGMIALYSSMNVRSRTTWVAVRMEYVPSWTFELVLSDPIMGGVCLVILMIAECAVGLFSTVVACAACCGHHVCPYR